MSGRHRLRLARSVLREWASREHLGLGGGV
jgi:hypothetical protein